MRYTDAVELGLSNILLVPVKPRFCLFVLCFKHLQAA